jgi:signal transduction histidine kinase
MPEQFVILCCENIRREVDAVLLTGALPNATAVSFPFHCGHIRSAWETIKDPYHVLENAGANICLCGCGCSNTLDIPKDVLARPARILVDAGPSLFLPETMAEDLRKRGAYVKLPGRLLRWKQNAECNKLDQTTAQEMFRESVSEIVILDTGVHPGIGPVLAEFAKFYGRPARTIPVGIGYFRLRLIEHYLRWECERESALCKAAVTAAEKRVADYSMVADLTGTIIGIHDENAIILQMLDLIVMLCSPKRAGFLPVLDEGAREIISIPPHAYTSAIHFQRIFDPVHPYVITKSGDGFLFQVRYNENLIGILSVDEVSIPNALDEYLNISHFIAEIAGLSITIARTHADLIMTVTERDAEIAERKRTKDALEMAIKKLNMLSSITRHDILNQIMGLRTFLELSREDLKNTRFADFIEKEDQAAEAIQRQIEFTKYYQDIGVNAAKWQDAAEVIHTAVTQLNPQSVDVEEGVAGFEIFADPLIVKVFFNLMENSLRHGEHVTEVAFSARESEAGLVITYRDNGVGITAEDKTKLFRKGFGKHTGLGLFLSQEILAITNITITETGVSGVGARFEITIPAGGFRFSKTEA